MFGLKTWSGSETLVMQQILVDRRQGLSAGSPELRAEEEPAGRSPVPGEDLLVQLAEQRKSSQVQWLIDFDGPDIQPFWIAGFFIFGIRPDINANNRPIFDNIFTIRLDTLAEPPGYE